MPRRLLPWAFALGCFILATASSSAFAYPWMIQHQYTTCSQCHVDPSGGSAMTAYGRAQTETLLRSNYGKPVEDPGKVKDFLFGAIPLPEEVIAQFDYRSLAIPIPDDFRLILMQADLRGGFQTDKVIAYASLGLVSTGANGARILSNEGVGDEVVTPVSRDYWFGVKPTNGVLIRGGRINLPFGIRTDQHILFTRAVTRTSTNADQQVGLAGSIEKRKWRSELMLVAGNFQTVPDSFRERGYSGTFSYAVDTGLEVGASSLVLGSAADISSLLPTTRQAHGVFSRWSPVERWSFLGEINGLVTSTRGDTPATAGGIVGDVRFDVEAVRGLHFKAGGEYCDTSFTDDSASGRGWGAVQWFFAPHFNVRVDMMYGARTCTPGTPDAVGPMGLAQLHAFL